ncbi:Hpt domain-containing protein [Candidatus Sulfurimonas marisnigri]|uniref:Hpt domain-containing protein n=1 Tax=Candidatus Sulfurimonas marisnigri TaxID=2740405 RepID=A0A7S7RQT3_9BACT|nr:Hpt domain-containing protein [Candidatus Sulfurimonas marisnigri]QOY55016.1 Hpt domain-containing protein [Candidatus Sulfurimonas marisnigri]
MLIYNYKKEFLGIDASDLETLGLSNLADLRNEAADFADLFVKTPGYIHNFKHVHWIDYILCEDDGVGSKAIIHIKGKNYTTMIDIKSIYLVDNPSERAFIVNLSNVRPLSQAQSEKFSADILQKPAPATATGSTELITTPGSIVHDENSDVVHEKITKASFDPYETYSPEAEPHTVVDIYESQNSTEDLNLDAPLDIDFEEKVVVDEAIETETSQEPIQTLTKQPPEPEKTSDEEEDNGEFSKYLYTPQVASEELGLPIDLIEEFIQDFIAQAQSFKDDLYKSVADEDTNQLKIQSHKLKGVAANLRIEDALDALTIINNSYDWNEIKTKIDSLYKIVAKLSNKSPNIPEEIQNSAVEEDEEEDFVLSFKEESIAVPEVEKIQENTFVNDFSTDAIVDSDVPDSISVAELADDEFFKSEISDQNNELIDEDLSILDNGSDSDDEDIDKEALDIAITYDMQRIANDIGLDIDSFRELFEDYLSESHELSNTIIDSIEKNNLESCKNAAIKLKGMSDNMRIHKFDHELDSIISSTDISNVKGLIDNVTLKLNQISNLENR